MKILKTPLEGTRTKVLKLIDESGESLVFKGKELWSVVPQKILLGTDKETHLFLSCDSSTPLYIRDTEHVILF